MLSVNGAKSQNTTHDRTNPTTESRSPAAAVRARRESWQAVVYDMLPTVEEDTDSEYEESNDESASEDHEVSGVEGTSNGKVVCIGAHASHWASLRAPQAS